MIRLEFKVDDPKSTSGFELGELHLAGTEGSCWFHCMVVLSATLLMDQLRDWLVSGPSKTLEYNPADCSGFILFEKRKDGVDVICRGKLVARTDIRELILEVFRACGKLREFVARLPAGEAGQHDFDCALADFETLIS